MANLLAAVPVPPDFHFCDQSFSMFEGRAGQLRLGDCLRAEAKMPRGIEPVRYYKDNFEAVEEVNFPLTYEHKKCLITVQLIDPWIQRPEADGWFDIAPDQFREMAGWLITRCAGSMPPLGGFVTRNISNAIDYLRLPTATLEAESWPKNATFFTVQLTTPSLVGSIYPGHFDPATGGAIFSSLYETLLNTAKNNPLWDSLNNMAEQINRNWARMRRGDTDRSSVPWHGNYAEESLPQNPTTYECDAKLGNPKHVDCSQLQYSQLDPVVENLALEPGITKFLHSETCNIGISALKSTVVTWKQIKSAVDEIIEACVNNPLRKSVGGTAFNGHQGLFDINIAGRRKRDVDSLAALPPGVNITLFQQLELYPTLPNDQEEMESCTWQKALHHQDVRPCQSIHHRPHP